MDRWNPAGAADALLAAAGAVGRRSRGTDDGIFDEFLEVNPVGILSSHEHLPLCRDLSPSSAWYWERDVKDSAFVWFCYIDERHVWLLCELVAETFFDCIAQDFFAIWIDFVQFWS